MKNVFYVLIDKKVYCEPDPIEWAQAYANMKTEDRLMGYDKLGEIVVSTVFTGLDMSYGMDKVPYVFETMVIGGL
jgi:hypothetical protein